MRPLALRHLLTLAITLLTCALIALVMLTIGRAGVRRVETDIGDGVRLLADQMQDKFDRTLFERYREISTAARLFKILDRADRREAAKAWIEELQTTYADYAWIGFARKDGTVRWSTNGLLEGTNIASAPWFAGALQEALVGDVHEDNNLAALLPKRGDAVRRFLNIAAPVTNTAGETVGVLGAHLDWSWADDVRDSLFGDTKSGRSEEVLVLTKDGVVLLGPPDLTGKFLPLKSVQAAMAGTSQFAVEDWPDGHRYVTGYARSDGYRNFGGLGWIVLVRQNAGLALAPARRLQRQFLLWSLGLAGLAALTAWVLAGRIAGPLLHLATSADGVRQGNDVSIPDVRDYAEAATLSQSLAALVQELKRRQSTLQAFNASLEAQVAERTAELGARNVALTHARTDAEDATAAKSRFLAAASHDLRQPLHAMTLFARALSRRVTGDEAPKLVSQLEASLSSLREMFDALLNVSRLDAGLIQANLGQVQVADMLTSISGGFRAEAESRDLRFICRPIDATIVTDPSLLESMLRNLVSNALKFTGTGGVILSARRRGGAIVFDVIDTGPGIPVDRQASIFQEFARARDHATGTNDGLGLGLSIVRRYAGLLGIEIKLASRVGHGTQISLAVPETAARARHFNPVSGSLTLAEQQRLTGARILLIDDDPNIVAGMEHELRDRGCVPLSFPTIAATVAALHAGLAFDVAIFDFDLGSDAQGQHQTGPAVLAAAERRRAAKIPALLLTGGTDAATLKFLASSGRPWLTKPASPDAVARALAALVGG